MMLEPTFQFVTPDGRETEERPFSMASSRALRLVIAGRNSEGYIECDEGDDLTFCREYAALLLRERGE